MDVHENGVTHGQSHPKLQVVTVMSVPPLKVTDPRRVRQVLVSDHTILSKTIRGCYHIVLYYNRYNGEDNGWSLTGWMVESLAKALLEQPLLAGRLQRKENIVDHDIMGLEIVSNDSGIRLLEAKSPLSLSQFLELNEKENLESDELVFWKEIDDQNPEFSPLFYVQVTNFECGGYSIGISCSLLLTEVLVVDNFLKKWADIHNKMMLPQTGEINNNQKPIFYHPCLKNHDALPNDVISRTLGKNRSETKVFKFTSKEVSFNNDWWKELAMICVDYAEQEDPEVKMGSEFPFFLKESTTDVIKVESCLKNGYRSVDGLDLKSKICRTTWNDFGLYEVTFCEGNKPFLVSCWIGSIGEGHVMAVPYPKENVSAVVMVSTPH